MRSKPESLRAGAAAADRRLLSDESATTSAPSRTSDGWSTKGAQWLRFVFELSGTDPIFEIQVWIWSSTALLWTRSETISLTENGSVKIECLGDERVYLQVTSVTGTGARISAWGDALMEIP